MVACFPKVKQVQVFDYLLRPGGSAAPRHLGSGRTDPRADMQLSLSCAPARQQIGYLSQIAEDADDAINELITIAIV